MSEQHSQPPSTSRPRRGWVGALVPATVAALAVAGGGVVMASGGSPASATPHASGSHLRLVAAPQPAPGNTWIQGVITDQANHALDNVNVEVWPAAPGASAPVASNLTYAGVPADARHQHGVFRVEVPSNQPYVIVMSGVGGSEDGDQYRMKTLGGGRPIMARAAGGAAKAATGRVLDLGKFQLVHQGHVKSTTTAKLAKKKVASGQRATLKVTVKSKYVSAPTGKLIVHVGGKKVTDRLRSTDHGTDTIRLPKIKKAGKHRITVTFPATSTISRSASKPVQLTVK
jgi:hypothetical protein